VTEHIRNLEHDKDADAIYIYLADKPYAFGEDLDHERRVDYAEDRTPVGIELLAVSTGVDTRDLPYQAEVATVLQAADIPQYA
jgi:uncharacterized protein YuzE